MGQTEYFRSAELMEPEATALVLVDIQEKLLPLINGATKLLWNSRRLRRRHGFHADDDAISICDRTAGLPGQRHIRHVDKCPLDRALHGTPENGRTGG